MQVETVILIAPIASSRRFVILDPEAGSAKVAARALGVTSRLLRERDDRRTAAALLAQLGLSRVREFDADHTAARLTGDPQGLASALARIERITRSWRAWALPGWGNPEPSWLRTHPPTADRVARLLELAPRQEGMLQPASSCFAPRAPSRARAPHWHVGGYWR